MKKQRLDLDSSMFDKSENLASPSIPKRLLILATGILVALVTITPNVMLSSANVISSYFGIAGSILFGIGGCIGGYLGRWKILCPGIVLQCVCFAIMGL